MYEYVQKQVSAAASMYITAAVYKAVIYIAVIQNNYPTPGVRFNPRTKSIMHETADAHVS